jgi:hypothetical protein
LAVERLILEKWQSRDYTVLETACHWAGIDVIRIPKRALGALAHKTPIDGTALRGGTSFCRKAARLLGARVLEPADDFLPSLPRQYSKRTLELMTLAEARLITDRRFIKPVNDKFFPAGVYENGDEVPSTIHGETIAVIASDPVVWEVEYRLFVLDREVRAISPYGLAEGVRAEPRIEAEARAFGETALADPAVRLPRAVVLDVGIIQDAGWAVVEANTAVMSGIYDCEPESVLEVLAAGIEPTE